MSRTGADIQHIYKLIDNLDSYSKRHIVSDSKYYELLNEIYDCVKSLNKDDKCIYLFEHLVKNPSYSMFIYCQKIIESDRYIFQHEKFRELINDCIFLEKID